jgi:hypothetical protein
LQHSQTVVSGEEYIIIFFDQPWPPSSELAPNILLFPSLRSSQAANTFWLSAPNAIKPSLATVSTSFTLAACDHFPELSFL